MLELRFTTDPFCEHAEEEGPDWRDKLGKTLDEVEAIVAGVKILQGRGVQKMTAAEAITAAPELQPTGRPKKGSDNPPLPKGSTSKDRLAARIKRDHPEIAAQAGEYKSVRAMAIAAGIIRVPTALIRLAIPHQRFSEDAVRNDREPPYSSSRAESVLA